MGYFQRKVIALLAFLAFAGAYRFLHESGFALEGAAAASYTVAVFGNGIRKRGIKLFSGETAKPFTEIFPGHFLFLIALVAIVALGALAATSLPPFLTEPITVSRYGRPGPSGLRLLQAALLFLLGFVESSWLTAVQSNDPDKPKVVWTQAALEEERMNRLRLH